MYYDIKYIMFKSSLLQLFTYCTSCHDESNGKVVYRVGRFIAQDVGQLTQLIQELRKENSLLHRQVSILNNQCTKLEAELENVKQALSSEYKIKKLWSMGDHAGLYGATKSLQSFFDLFR